MIAGPLRVVRDRKETRPKRQAAVLSAVQRARESTFRHIDHPPRGRGPQAPSPGDVAITGGTLRNTSNRRAGKAHVVFMRLKGRRKAHVDQVSGTFDLKGGQIVMEGVSDGGRTDVVAITGGTGTYAGARGTVRVSFTRTRAHIRLTFIG